MGEVNFETRHFSVKIKGCGCNNYERTCVSYHWKFNNSTSAFKCEQLKYVVLMLRIGKTIKLRAVISSY